MATSGLSYQWPCCEPSRHGNRNGSLADHYDVTFLTRRVRRLLLVLAALLGATLLAAGPASAHASVVASDPADGSRLKSVPASVTISFDEQVGLGTLGYLHVTNQSGTRVEAGAAFHPRGDGSQVTVKLKSGLPDGTYVESYRVLSADSHPVAGVERFVVGSGPLVMSAAGSPGSFDHVVSAGLDVARWGSYAGFALLGGAWLLLTVWPQGREDRRALLIVWTGWTVTAVGAVFELLLQGAYLAGAGLRDAVRPSLVDATLHTNYGQLHCARLLLLGGLGALLALALQPGRRRARIERLAWPLALAIAFTFAATGHARTTDPSWLSLVLDTAHLSAMAIWVGGLVLLVGALLARRDAAEAAAVIPVFSRAAFAAIGVLAVTGTYAAWRGVGSWRALFSTEYGLLVAVKLALFAGILALGNMSRRIVQRRFGTERPKRPGRPAVAYAMTDSDSSDQTADTERLRRSVLVEIVVAAVVLVATSVLVGQPRGAEALAAQDRAPVSASAALGDGGRVQVTLAPGRHGIVDVAISLSGGAVAKSLTATATQPDQQLGPIPLHLRADGTHAYDASGVTLPVPGTWIIAVVVTRSQFDAISAQVTLHLS